MNMFLLLCTYVCSITQYGWILLVVQYGSMSDQMVAAKRGAVRAELKNGLSTGRMGNPYV